MLMPNGTIVCRYSIQLVAKSLLAGIVHPNAMGKALVLSHGGPCKNVNAKYEVDTRRLPLGHYKFVMRNLLGDGMCCDYNMDSYYLWLIGNDGGGQRGLPGGLGHSVYESNGIFLMEEVTEFQVVENDFVSSSLPVSSSAGQLNESDNNVEIRSLLRKMNIR
jgi:hypothetical protein